MDEENVTVEKPVDTPAVEVKLDEAIFNDLEKSMSEFIETVKEKETTETVQTEKMDELLQKMIENEDAASEKALLDKEAEELAKIEAMAAMEEIDPDAVDLATIYNLLKQKTEDDAEALKSFEYLTCDVPEEVDGTEEIEEAVNLCTHLELNNEKLDALIEQGQLVSFYGYIVIPGILISLLFYKILKWFT